MHYLIGHNELLVECLRAWQEAHCDGGAPRLDKQVAAHCTRVRQHIRAHEARETRANDTHRAALQSARYRAHPAGRRERRPATQWQRVHSRSRARTHEQWRRRRSVARRLTLAPDKSIK